MALLQFLQNKFTSTSWRCFFVLYILLFIFSFICLLMNFDEDGGPVADFGEKLLHVFAFPVIVLDWLKIYYDWLLPVFLLNLAANCLVIPTLLDFIYRRSVLGINKEFKK